MKEWLFLIREQISERRKELLRSEVGKNLSILAVNPLTFLIFLIVSKYMILCISSTLLPAVASLVFVCHFIVFQKFLMLMFSLLWRKEQSELVTQDSVFLSNYFLSLPSEWFIQCQTSDIAFFLGLNRFNFCMICVIS